MLKKIYNFPTIVKKINLNKHKKKEKKKRVYACACVCMCVRERARERPENYKKIFENNFYTVR